LLITVFIKKKFYNWLPLMDPNGQRHADEQMNFCEIKIKTRVYSVALIVVTVKPLVNTTGQTQEQ